MADGTRLDRRVPQEQLVQWLELVRSARGEIERQNALRCYFETVLPEVLKRLESVPEHQELRDLQTHTLVSLMGFSPETTVISAAVVRPKQLIVIYGAPDDEEKRLEVEFSYNIAHEYLTSSGILDRAAIHQHVINPLEPIEIYEIIRAAIDQTPTINDNRSALVDITGGKKVMSATGGQVAWEARLPLLYIEGEYDPNLRRPWPGTEDVIKLDNPSGQALHQMRIDALSLYANRNYPVAVDAFEKCEANRNENRLDVIGSCLSRVYVRWTDLDLPELRRDVETLTRRLKEPRIQRLFQDRRQPREALLTHLETFKRVCDAEPVAMIASFLELAQLYQSDSFQRFDFACLLVYRAMEATVELGLRQIAGESFNLRDPVWSLLKDEATLVAEYTALSASIDTKRSAEQSLPKHIGFVNGIALLCLCNQLHDRAGMQKEDFTKMMRAIAQKRNESILAHGVRTLNVSDFSDMSRMADRLAEWVLQEGHAEVVQLREELQPIDLKPLNDPAQA